MPLPWDAGCTQPSGRLSYFTLLVSNSVAQASLEVTVSLFSESRLRQSQEMYPEGVLRASSLLSCCD